MVEAEWPVYAWFRREANIRCSKMERVITTVVHGRIAKDQMQRIVKKVCLASSTVLSTRSYQPKRLEKATGKWGTPKLSDKT